MACSAKMPSSSIPPMRGIFRSVITIDGDHCVAFSSPSAPSRAVSTRKPQEDTSSASPERSFSSSSTISIFSWLIGFFVVYLSGHRHRKESTHLSNGNPNDPTIRGMLLARQGLDRSSMFTGLTGQTISLRRRGSPVCRSSNCESTLSLSTAVR